MDKEMKINTLGSDANLGLWLCKQELQSNKPNK